MDSSTNLTNAIDTARQYHMRTMTEDVPSDTSTRWAQKIKETLEKENLHFVDFLQKPAEDFPSVVARKEFLTKLADPSLNPYASWFDIYLKHIPNHTLDHDTEVMLGVAKTRIDKIMDIYKHALTDLFHYDNLMFTKLKRLERKQSDLLSICDLEETSEESIALRKSILNYIHHIYESSAIENDYVAFCQAYARVMTLRSAIMPMKRVDDRLHKSVCGICMNKEIEMALVPCGHVCCADCAKKQQSQCYVCRLTVRERLRLYF